MSSLAFLWPTAACIVAGLALYVTRGVLDQTVTATGITRFAMLPPWQALVGFTCLAALVLAAIDHLNAPRGTTTAATRPRLRDLVLPAFALAVLLIPYLPLIPDRWPALQALAGPLSGVVWLAIAALQVWVLWQSRLVTARIIGGWSVSALALAIFVLTAAASGFAASRLTSTPLFPSGDEPHYLVIAQSLWKDGDLKIQNNHEQGDYFEYYLPELEPHYLTRGSDGEIYSIHPIGIAVLMAPIYGLGGYNAVVAALIVMAALTLMIAWRLTVSVLNAPGAATFAWAVLALTAPYLLNSITVYPEIAAGLAVMIAFAGTLPRPRADGTPGRTDVRSYTHWVAAAVAIAILPWLSTKYAPMSAALLLVLVYRARRAQQGPLFRNRNVLILAGVYALSLVAWFTFFYVYWGTPSPTAPYGSLTQTEPRILVRGGPGLLFDQEYGLLAIAPVYILAATGLFRMWRDGGESRDRAIEIAFVFGTLLTIVGAFGVWWGGSSAPSRPIASGLPLLMLPMATAFRAAPPGSARRAGHHLLLWISIGIAVTLIAVQDGLLINNARDGTSALLEYWMPRWETWTLAPTFIGRRWYIAYLQSAWWLAVAGGAAWVLGRMRRAHPGASALVAAVVLAGALLVLTITMPLIPAAPPLPGVDLSARSRLAALDGFDTRVRPAAVIYDPMRKVPSAAVLPQLVLSVRPEQRTDLQPLRVIHNGRFSLPAGTYTIDVRFNDDASDRTLPLSLQVGRAGPPLQTWTVRPHAGERLTTSLWLPLDASFVGMRGPSEMERAVEAITITPAAVVDAGARPNVPVVVAAANYPGASLFFHDEKLYPEPTGFWMLGNRTSAITVALAEGRTSPVVLRMHSGAKENTATFSTFGWRRDITFEPGKAVEMELPMMAGGIVPLEIHVASGFSPREIDPAATDPRFLGIWIEVQPPQ
jgi:hypothetical protein